MEGFGEEERGREVCVCEAEFRSCVFEGTVLGRVVAIPATRGEARRIGSEETRCVPLEE